MKNTTFVAILLLFASIGWAQPTPAPQTETRYLTFQVWPRMHGYPGIPSTSGRFTLGKADMQGFVRDVAKAIGTTGDTRHKLGFAVGPFSFDVADDDTRQWIRDAFAVARENDVAVALHIDDSMSWGERKDLLSNPDNIETADWEQVPNTARSLAWGPNPTRFPPQMCYNAPAIVTAAKDRGRLIGAEIKRELAALKSAGKEHLFAGVIAGPETQISPEFGTNRRLGFRALAHRGFSEKNPPKDLDAERVSVVREWIELWCNALHEGGTPREKIFCHIAFTDQGLRKADAKESYAEKVHFAVPEVAFSSAYRPGFSTYPEGRTFKEVYAVLEKHGSPGWISAEGTNVSPTGMPGEPTMETYLGRMFNHGAVMTNVFSWGIGGEAQRNNFFRRATENPECLAAYAKFLRGEQLVESAATGFSSEAFQAKMRRIQEELPAWAQKTGQQGQAMALGQKVQSLIKEKKWQEADKVADELLALIKGEKSDGAKTDGTTDPEGLPARIQKIQKELPAWVGSDEDRKSKATVLMQELKEQLDAKNFDEAGKTVDAILKLIGASAPATSQGEDAQSRQHVLHELGGPFFISRDKVQEELKLTDDQKQKLRKTMSGYVQETMKIQRLKSADREQAMKSLRPKSYEELGMFLKENFSSDQLNRFEQLKLQYDVPSILVQPEIVKKLDITDEQRQKFIGIIQEMQKEMEPVMKAAKSGGNPQEILPKVIKMRRDCEGKIVALLTTTQKQQWEKMTGKRFDIW